MLNKLVSAETARIIYTIRGTFPSKSIDISIKIGHQPTINTQNV